MWPETHLTHHVPHRHHVRQTQYVHHTTMYIRHNADTTHTHHVHHTQYRRHTHTMNTRHNTDTTHTPCTSDIIQTPHTHHVHQTQYRHHTHTRHTQPHTTHTCLSSSTSLHLGAAVPHQSLPSYMRPAQLLWSLQGFGPSPRPTAGLLEHLQSG